MNITAFILFLASIVSVVLADFMITNPTAATTWHTGSKATIRWLSKGVSVASDNSVPLYLLKGDPKNLKRVAKIGDVRGSASGVYQYDVPSTLSHGSSYVVQMGGGHGSVHYSHQFTIA